jgi:hypothetical protein
MMLEAGSNPRVKNKGGLTAVQLVDPSNAELKETIRKHEFASQNAGDYVNVEVNGVEPGKKKQAVQETYEDEDDDDAEFSGSDEEERAEWERRRKARRG